MVKHISNIQHEVGKKKKKEYQINIYTILTAKPYKFHSFPRSLTVTFPFVMDIPKSFFDEDYITHVQKSKKTRNLSITKSSLDQTKNKLTAMLK